MCPCEEIPQVNKLAMFLILDYSEKVSNATLEGENVHSHTIDNTPPVLPPTDLFAIDDYRLFGAHHGEWNDVFNLGI